MSVSKKKIKHCLVLSSRQFGDAILIKNFIDFILQKNKNLLFYVYGRPEHREIYADKNIIFNDCFFPIDFSRSKFYFNELIILIKKLFEIRRKNFDFCFSFFGDFREDTILNYSNSKKLFFIKWKKEHPYRNLVRPFIFNFNKPIYFTPDKVGVIDIFYSFAKFFTKNTKLITPYKQYLVFNKSSLIKKTIAIFPISPLRSKNWPIIKWILLINKLITHIEGIQINIYVSKKDGLLFNSYFLHFKNIKVHSLSLIDLFDHVKVNNFSFCLDSFGLHLSNYLGIKNICINGANNHKLLANKNSKIIYNGGNCDYYPCYIKSRPKCLNTKFEYACIDGISVDQVFNLALRQIL